MIAIDTNVAVRYLTGDHPDQSPRARALIDANPVFVPVTMMLETEWVLRSAYGFAPPAVVHALRAFGGLPTVIVEDANHVAQALDLAGQGMELADALHLSRSAHRAAFATFDRRFVKAATAAGVTALQEP